MTEIFLKYKKVFQERSFVYAWLISLLFLAAALTINFYAGLYATERASNAVTDIILSNIPVFDVDGVFVWGAIAFWISVILLILTEPKQFPFTIKSVALFIVIRSLFITLTHVGPFPNEIAPDPQSILSGYRFVTDLFYGKDLFFSGHTGLPFLMALIFWDNRILRYSFITGSILFGAVVLMAHVHYSIDVLAAFFITYSIYRLATKFFTKDLIFFNQLS